MKKINLNIHGHEICLECLELEADSMRLGPGLVPARVFGDMGKTSRYLRYGMFSRCYEGVRVRWYAVVKQYDLPIYIG